MKRVLSIAVLLAAAYGIAVLLIRPRNDRDWSPDQSRLAVATRNGPFVTIRNVRDFDYRSTTDYTPRWYDRTYDLRKLESVWFAVEPFGRAGAAHTLVSFGFRGGEYVAMSVEIRKEKGESFSVLKGLLRQYELMYVVGSERDLIGLRTNHRKDDVYLYPVRTTPERRQAMFLGMLWRANELRAEPEFYNTLTNTCTTNLVRHVNQIRPGRIPLRAAVFLPADSDRLAYELGLLDTNLPFEAARRHFYITRRAQQADMREFSRAIR